MSRDIKLLHPTLQEKIARLKELCEEKGLIIGFAETLRTVAEQDALYAQGRTKPGNKVTNAKGSSYQSQHQWGIAIDFFKNIKGHEYDDLSFFNQVGALAKSIGLAWGGDWTSPVDRPHLYLPDWGSTTTKLRKQYGTPDKFIATWKTASSSTSNTVVAKGIINTVDAPLRIRKSGSESAEIIGRANKGEKVDILEIGKEWHKIKYGNIVGYSSAEYIKIESNATNVAKPNNVTNSPKYKVGNVYTLQTEVKVRTGAGTNHRAKKYSELTVDGRKHDKDGDGALDKGTKVTCKDVKVVNGDTWIKTPSGWLAAIYKGEVFIK